MRLSEVKVGDRFGRLFVLEIRQHYNRDGRKNGFDILCKCDCGNETVVRKQNLLRGITTSCGCVKLESSKKNLEFANEWHKQHPEMRMENARRIGKLVGKENIKKAQEYLNDNPEIRLKNIARANEYLSSHIEIRQQNGRKTGGENIKYAHAY